MVLTKKQIDNLLKIDFSGRRKYDEDVATALGWSVQDEIYHDAIDTKGDKVEFKKQSGQQWIDAFKLCKMSKDDRKIGILFFMHKDGHLTSIYHTTYAKLIKEMGYDDKSLMELKKVAKIPAFDKHQMKAVLNVSSIRKFKRIY